MKIIDVRSKLPVKGSNGTQNPTMIVVHHSAVTRPERYNSLELYKKFAQDHINRGWKRMSYHYVIDNVGDVYRCNDDHQILYHAGHLPTNKKSIAIMFDGNMEIQDLTDKQKKSYWELIEYIKKNNNITKIVGHRDIKATACPGKNAYKFINTKPENKPEPMQYELTSEQKRIIEDEIYSKVGDNVDTQDIKPIAEGIVKYYKREEAYENTLRKQIDELNKAVAQEKQFREDTQRANKKMIEERKLLIEQNNELDKELDKVAGELKACITSEDVSERYEDCIDKMDDLRKKYEIIVKENNALKAKAPSVGEALTILVQAIKKVWK
jgi:hypothetical protein